MSELFRLLSRSEAFETMADDDAQALAAIVVEERLAAGAFLFRAGEDVGGERGVYLVLEGTLAVRLPRPDGGQFEARTIEAGELVGVMGLLHGSRRRKADVVAITDAQVAHVPAGAFRALVQGSDRLSVGFLMAVGRQMARDLRRVDAVAQAAAIGGG